MKFFTLFNKNNNAQFDDESCDTIYIDDYESQSNVISPYQIHSDSSSIQSDVSEYNDIEFEMETYSSNQNTPVFLVDGLFSNSSLITMMAENEVNTYAVELNPYGSLYDRAIQLFHIIKGEICYFGTKCNDKHHHTDLSIPMNGIYPEWSEKNPVHFVCYSFGGNTVRELMYLLENRKIPMISYNHTQYYNTNSKWIKSIVTIGSPLGGIENVDYFFSKYCSHIGWMFLAHKLFTVESTSNRYMYWNLHFCDMLFLTKNKLLQKLDHDIIFEDIDSKKIKRETHLYSKQVFHVPVLKIILEDDVASTESQRMFYHEYEGDIQYHSIEQFKCQENEDAYFLLKGVKNIDFINNSEQAKSDFIRDMFFQIKNVLSKL